MKREAPKPRNLLIRHLSGIGAGMFLGLGIFVPTTNSEIKNIQQIDQRLDELYHAGGYQPLIGSALGRPSPHIQAEIDRQNSLRQTAIKERLAGWSLFAISEAGLVLAGAALVRRHRQGETVKILT